jgi:hypothetical protein
MKPTISNTTSALDIVRNLLLGTRSQTWLIICSSRPDFLRQLLQWLSGSSTESPRTSQRDHRETNFAASHDILAPILDILANSRAINTAYCPTIDSLRACLATYDKPSEDGPVNLNASVGRSRLVILDMVSLHHSTSEFSVQGLMRTFSSAVQAAARNNMTLALNECKDPLDQDSPIHGPVLWDSQVPLLSGSVRMGGEASAFTGRRITVRRIAERWFRFENVTDLQQERIDDEEEMLV